MLVLTERAWIVPSSKRSLTAALTRRCWSIRERPANWVAATTARRWSPLPVSSLTSTAAPGRAASIIAFSSSRSAATGLARDPLADRLQHLLDADELDARPPVRLAAANLGLVDCLPVLEADVADVALAQQVLDGSGIGLLGLEQGAGLDVGEQVLDGLQGVFLVRADHAGGAALDPAGGVVAGLVAGVVGVEDAA